ncbi:uncharacterized protein LOC143822465 [Paroedura picta]|uniref:uncharacterized protein LOC143822465 n=1 Tax=Paroedura picta TaxID=143630 RepID=UPI004056CBD0
MEWTATLVHQEPPTSALGSGAQEDAATPTARPGRVTPREAAPWPQDPERRRRSERSGAPASAHLGRRKRAEEDAGALPGNRGWPGRALQRGRLDPGSARSRSCAWIRDSSLELLGLVVVSSWIPPGSDLGLCSGSIQPLCFDFFWGGSTAVPFLCIV